jgi:nucleoside-diphosphate-sugar epimerase
MTLSTTIPKGSLVLVTGATGFIASHIILEFLKRGYKVRGTVRDASKANWLLEETFPSYVAAGSFELVTVPDMVVENAFEEAVKGVSAIAHVASVISLDPNPHNVIPQTVAGAVNALKAAAKEPTVKEFVFTSSVVAAAMPVPNQEFHVDSNSWNTFAVDLAYAPPPYDPIRGMIVYMASKVEAEKALWKWVEENKPSFTVNAVNPYTTLGRLLNRKQRGSTHDWVMQLYRGETGVIEHLSGCKSFHIHFPQSFITLTPNTKFSAIHQRPRRCLDARCRNT